MTFQVGIVGEDGVLLASDRANTRLEAQVRTTFASEKITVASSRKLAYCCAGDDFTQTVADELFSRSLPSGPEGASTKEIILLALSTAHRKAISLWKTGGSILMAHDAGNTIGLWRIVLYNKEICPIVTQILDRDFQGDCINPAAFFIERYLSSEGYVKMPLERLKGLAAHTVLMASELNRKQVHGLDIALCRPGKPFEVLDASALEELGALSRECDSTLAHSLGLARLL